MVAPSLARSGLHVFDRIVPVALGSIDGLHSIVDNPIESGKEIRDLGLHCSLTLLAIFLRTPSAVYRDRQEAG